jgi:hypothetical protein
MPGFELRISIFYINKETGDPAKLLPAGSLILFTAVQDRPITERLKKRLKEF